jgi:hypothetical protein
MSDLQGYDVYPIEKFGGLNLHDKVDVVSPNQAIDGLNVEHTRQEAVRQRDGYDNLTSSELTNQPNSMSPYTSGSTRYLVVQGGTRIDSLDTSGATQANNATTDAVHSFAEFGSPGTDALFIANGTDEILQLAGTSFSTPDYEMTEGGTDVGVKSKYVAAWKDRLVGAENANSTGFTSDVGKNKDTVRFSDAGDPTIWGVNNYIQLSPGDGEPIMGVIAWRELLFVFKQTKFFVFYGTSVDSDGNPIFNYRPVEAGIGLASARALCAGRDGVYFMDRKGVYRTTGQEPQYLSEDVEPIFSGGASAFFQGGTLLHSQIANCVMDWTNERIHLAYTSTSTTNNYMLVYDTRYQWWELWNIPASCMATFRPGNNDELVFGYPTGSNYVGRFSFVPDTYTTDDGTAITSRWQSGWFDVGTPNEKVIRQTRVTGEGKVNLGIADDFQTSPTTTALDFTVSQPLWDTAVWDTDVWGAITSYKTKLVRRAIKGKVFSLYLTNSISGQGFAVYRCDPELRGTKQPALSIGA